MKFLIQRLTLAVAAVLCVASLSAQNTNVTFNLTDSFGDGWCGGNIIVSGMQEQVTGADGACEPVLEPVGFSQPVGTDSGFTTGTSWTEQVAAAVGSVMTCTWMNDPFNGETGYTIINGDGTVVTMGGGGSGLPVSFVVAGPPVECPDCPPATGATFTVTGVDGFGDGWDQDGIFLEAFSEPGGTGISCGTENLLEEFDFGTSFTETSTLGVPEGGSVVFTWGVSCSIFAGEIEEIYVDLNLPGSSVQDPNTGECVFTPGTTAEVYSEVNPSGICAANQAFFTFDVGNIMAGGLTCPSDTVVVLEGGDCWPVETYCIGTNDFLIDPITDVCPFVTDVYVVNNFTSLFQIDPANAADCDPMASCENGMFSVCGTNEEPDDDTCPNIDLTGFGGTIINIFYPANPDYDNLVISWNYTPDDTPDAIDDQVSFVPIDANGNWTANVGLTGLINNFGTGPQSGTTNIDMANFGFGQAAGIAIYILSTDLDGGAACLDFTAEFVDNDGKIFTVGASNDAACDAELTYDVDTDAGSVTINYIPGINEVCFLLTSPDGCDAVTCSFTYEVDNSIIKETLTCNDHVNISVDNGCEALITADMILEGSPYYCDEEYIVEITTPGGVPVDNPVVYDPTYAPNNEYVVSIYDPFTCNSCWGTFTLEDKLDPTLECPCPPGLWVTDPSCQIECLDIPRYLNGQRGAPTTFDNCGGDDAVFSGATATEIECGVYVVEQIWTLTVPGYGGQDVPTTLTCVNQYYSTSPSLEDELDCPDDVEYDCTEGGDPSLTHPEETGYPEFGNIELGSGEQEPYCNVFAGYEDLEIPACGPDCYGPIKIFRTWTVLDWCTGETETCQQVIKITDSTPPTILANDITVSTEPWVCSADVWLPDPHLHDDCDYNLDWCIASTNSGGTLVDEDGRTNQGKPLKHALNVPKGWWEFTLKSTDCCGNTAYTTIYVHVVDLTPPVAVATQNIVVSLTSSGDDFDGLAKLYKNSVDNGSHDNCSDVWCEIRRDEDPCGLDGNTTYSNKIPEICDPWYDGDDHDYGEYVKFCCEDLTDIDEATGVPYGIVKVWMRVWDDGNMDGVHGSYTYYDNPGNNHDYCDFEDNYNETWVHVRVEDKAPVQLICPPDVTIPCHWDWTDTSITGVAAASSTCANPCVDYTDWPEVHCGEGYVLREWRVVDCDSGDDLSEYVCVQRITVTPVETPLEVVCPTAGNFSGDILWEDPNNPTHIAIDCDDFDFPEPVQYGGKCNLIGVSSTIDTFWFEENACFKAVKRWTYVDWCTNDEATCEFTVSVVDTEPPTVTCQDTCVAVNDYWDDDEDGIYCEMEGDVDVSASAEDAGDCESVWIKWVVVVDYWNDGIVDEEYSSFLAPNDPYYLAPTPSGEEVTIDLDKDELGGEWARHTVEWKAFDGCGNVDQCVQLVEVADKKAPTPYCVGISTALMSPEAGNLVELWAKDFNLGSFDNCTQEHWLRYTFGEVPPVLDLIDEEHCFQPVWDDRDNCVPMRDADTGYIVSEEDNNCGDYEDGAARPDCPLDGVQKWNPNGVDADGNPCKTSGMKYVGTDWCGVNPIRISVWDTKFNMDFCWVDLVVHGAECSEGDTPRIEGTVSTESGATLEGAMVTNTSSLLVQTDMTNVDGEYAFDFNIMGEDYAITAAKNNDWLNGVSTLDLVMIQRHILGLNQLNSGYKLVAADINNDENVTAVDLVELRKLILGIYTELPNNQSWRFIDAKQSLSSVNPWPINEEVNISSIADDMMSEDFVAAKVGDVNGSAVTNLAGNSTELRTNGNLDFVVETVGNSVVVKAGANFDNVYGYQFSMNVDGQLSGVYAGALDVTNANFGVLENGEVTTSFASESGVSLSEGEVLFTLEGVSSVNLVNGFTKAEAYATESLDIVNVSLRDGVSTSVYSLSQNEPNPFSDVTNIAFTLGEAGPATLTVYDVTGKVITTVEGEYERGNHVIQVAKRDLGATGIMYYQLESGDFTATKKMIIIE